MPVGNPIFENITVEQFLNSEWFGFLKCSVRSPEGLTIGLLPIRREGKLISPVGTLTGIWFSPEIRFALENGYELLAIEFGYRFERNNQVFKELILHLNEMKENAQVNNNPVQRNIAKLLMNSLYGRFGLRFNENNVVIANEELSQKIAQVFPINRAIEFTNGTELIEFTPHAFFSKSFWKKRDQAQKRF
jgi:hypothetical protein